MNPYAAIRLLITDPADDDSIHAFDIAGDYVLTMTREGVPGLRNAVRGRYGLSPETSFEDASNWIWIDGLPYEGRGGRILYEAKRGRGKKWKTQVQEFWARGFEAPGSDRVPRLETSRRGLVADWQVTNGHPLAVAYEVDPGSINFFRHEFDPESFHAIARALLKRVSADDVIRRLRDEIRILKAAR